MADVVVLGRNGDSIDWDPAFIFARDLREEPGGRKAADDVTWLSAQDIAQRIVAGEFIEAGVPVPARLALPALASAVNSVHRWTDEGRIFAVHELYPHFQFDERGHPYAAVEQVVQYLGANDVLRIGNWFASPNPHLNGRRPQQLLAADSAAVVRALQFA